MLLPDIIQIKQNLHHMHYKVYQVFPNQTLGPSTNRSNPGILKFIFHIILYYVSL